MGSIIKNIDNIVELENYSPSDVSLLSSKSFVRNFGEPSDYVEMHIYSPNNDLLFSDYHFTGFSIPGSLQGSSNTKTNLLDFTPDKDIFNQGYAVGDFNIQYNILRNRIFSAPTPVFFITDISSDRTEIRVASNFLSDSDIESGSLSFISDLQSSSYYKDFLLNFGSNTFYIAVNLALDKNTSPFNILIKLYQPLPSSVNINDSFWIVEELSDSYTYSVELFPDPIDVNSIRLRSPNFDINVDSEQIRSSEYNNYVELISSNNNVLYQKILNYLSSNNVSINIDYSNFINFVHFSSAKQRLLNFVYKVQQIENYNSQINQLSSSFVSPSVSSSISFLQNNINTIFNKFDGYDDYLYFNSESGAWPKLNSTQPYILYPSTSSQVTTWLGSDDSFNINYGGQLYSSSFYDSTNPNNLIYSVPEFLLIDPQNQNYELFVEMIGQHFDYIWTYTKALGDLYKTNNSLNKGISKDLVYYALSSFGIKLYNDNSNQNLSEYLIGITTSGSYLPTTSSFETLITASSYTIPGQDRLKEIFKRIYHNVPYLLKTKGTDRGLRALSTIFGVPSTIMRFNEYGGMDKLCNTSQYSFDRFSYALNTEGSGSIVIGWDQLNINDATSQPSSFADSIEFRFKPSKVFTNVNYTQSLIEVGDGFSNPLFGLSLQYSSSNGIPYGNVSFFLNGSSSYAYSSPITLPIFATGSDDDTHWWNVLIRRRNQSFSLENDLIDFDLAFITDSDFSDINVGSFDSSGSIDQYYDIFIKNEINGLIGHQGSSSLFVSESLSGSYNSSWDTEAQVYIGGYDHSNTIHPNGVRFLGELQELRFWSFPLYQSRFNKHVLNPESIEGNFSGSFYDQLGGWFPLGNDLHTYNHVLTSSIKSVHPNKISTFPTASFIGFNNYNNYIPQIETYYADVPVVGYSSPITDKIRIQNISISGSVLSPFIRLEEPLDFPLTSDFHFINASFSPQNEIDEDIISSLGSTFTIDDYIGNPSEEGCDKYQNLENLKSLYFKKYFSKYDYEDYIKLLKYFDNSLFKMFNDFVAARTNLQTGITIRPTLLERSKVKRYSPEVDRNNNFTASIGKYHIKDDNTYGSNFYNGEVSGSNPDVYSYFEHNNHNPYLLGKGNKSIFKSTDFNVLLNNVQDNITSSIRRKIDENGTLLIPTSLQDYYYSYKRQIIPRYLGSKSTSKTYNFYTSQSYSGSTLIWNGDASYGKNAAIDSNTVKFAWIKQIDPTNLNFFDKTSIILKYLVDGNGSLTELSRHNFNVVDIQNIFKSGTTTIVSLSDLLNPSNQTTLDGNKQIFEGGFSYWPIVYRETAEQLHFKYLTSLLSTASISLNVEQTKLFQFASTKIVSPTKNIDDDTSDGGYVLKYGPDVVPTGQFAFSHVVPFTSWSYASISGLKEVSSVTFPSGAGAPGTFPGLPFTTGIDGDSNQFVYQINNTFLNFADQVSSNDNFSQYVQLSDGSYAYKVPRTSTYNFKVDVPFNISIEENGTGGTIIKTLAVLERNSGSNGDGEWQYLASSVFTHIESPSVAQFCWNNDKSILFLDFDSWTGGTNDHPIKSLCSINANIPLNANDYVRLSFFIIKLRDFLPSSGVDHGKLSFQNKFSNPPFDMKAGTMAVTDTINDTTIVTRDGLYTQASLFNLSGSGNNILQFTDSASLLYGKVIFDQASISSSTADLYSTIDYPFTFAQGDIIRLTSYFNSNPTYYRVNQVISPVTGSDGVTVFSDLALVLDQPVNIIGGLSSNFVIFRRLPDETSVILNFNKSPGEASQALLIPYDLDLSIKSNVANLVTQVSQQINAL